ncbi:MAG: VOC family protein [Thermoplasmata archaeon]
MHLRYFGIRVTDLDRSVKFYTDLLGLKETSRGSMSEYGGGRGDWVLLKDETSGQRLELNAYPEGSRWHAPYEPGEGLDHIGFVVDDVPAAYKKLVAGGAGPTDIDPASTEGHQAFVTDPDGNWIELFVHD